MKNSIAGIVAMVFIMTATAAAPASALSIDELQTQIKELLAKVATLQAQLQSAVGSQIPAIDPIAVIGEVTPKAHRICSILARNLSHGAQGDDVRGLQEFLNSEGYLSANATGYFGSLTAQAVAKWQESQGVSAVGILGPMSRERIKMWCGGGNGNDGLSASPNNGVAPLNVQFAYHPQGDDGAKYYIEFGDGSAQVMDTQQIYCIRAPCISSAVAPHTYSTAGKYTATVSRYIACLYSEPRCMIAQPPPLASATIVVRGTSTTNEPPTISSFSGPTTLAVNVSGTWTIQASDPENQPLKYSVVWGDEFQGLPAFMSTIARDVFVQTTTFTHSYAQAGIYTIIMVVSDASGAVAKTTSTVRVGDSQPVACTMDARQCPDGSWVGRTGPSCQFVCPNQTTN